MTYTKETQKQMTSYALGVLNNNGIKGLAAEIERHRPEHLDDELRSSNPDERGEADSTINKVLHDAYAHGKNVGVLKAVRDMARGYEETLLDIKLNKAARETAQRWAAQVVQDLSASDQAMKEDEEENLEVLTQSGWDPDNAIDYIW